MGKEAAKSGKEKKHFWKDFKAELKKVIWPTPKQVVNNTVAVITIVIITAVIVFVLDLAFEAMNTYGIDQIRGLVSNSQSSENAVDNQTDDTTNSTSDDTVEEGTDNTQEDTTSQNEAEQTEVSNEVE